MRRASRVASGFYFAPYPSLVASLQGISFLCHTFVCLVVGLVKVSFGLRPDELAPLVLVAALSWALVRVGGRC